MRLEVDLGDHARHAEASFMDVIPVINPRIYFVEGTAELIYCDGKLFADVKMVNQDEYEKRANILSLGAAYVVTEVSDGVPTKVDIKSVSIQWSRKNMAIPPIK